MLLDSEVVDIAAEHSAEFGEIHRLLRHADVMIITSHMLIVLLDSQLM